MGKEVRTYVELFAGCGGMSLGIESEGFRRLFANELSPMPAATYAFNLIHKKQPQSQNVEEWYTRLYGDGKTQSFYPNPDNYLADGVTDYALDKLGQLKGDMFVGGINQLNAALHKIPRETIEKIDVDILSGGPPCQSFSMAGRRDKNNVRNTLPFEFANSAQVLRPKVVLMENVSGILRPFRDEQGDEWFAWFEVAKTFFEKGYVPICVNVAASSLACLKDGPDF